MFTSRVRITTTIFLLSVGISVMLARGDTLALAQQEVEPDSAIAGGISPIAPSGWDQKDWDRRIVECKQINDLMFKRRPFTKEELAAIPPISHNDVENCWGMESPFKTKELTTPASTNPNKPIPLATPSLSPSSNADRKSDSHSASSQSTSDSSSGFTVRPGALGGTDDSSESTLALAPSAISTC
jgi:hypothetical protein